MTEWPTHQTAGEPPLGEAGDADDGTLRHQIEERPIAYQEDGPRQRPNRFMLLVYRVPAKPTATRVAVWRMLKKMGAIYLQQSVCVFPDTIRLRRELAAVLSRIEQGKGEYHLLPLRKLPPEEEVKLARQFLEQTNKHYDEIIENCEVNFTKEIEFETFRKNFTYEEAEEIRVEFEKICSWFAHVRERDWFGSPREADARAWIQKCEAMLEDFEAKVYAVQTKQGESAEGAVRSRRRVSSGRPEGAASGRRRRSSQTTLRAQTARRADTDS
jgi:hypothetical protein